MPMLVLKEILLLVFLDDAVVGTVVGVVEKIGGDGVLVGCWSSL